MYKWTILFFLLLPADNFLRFGKNLDSLQILDNKIKANKAQYSLDREAAKISVLSSGELENYEYLTGEDLGYKSDVVQKEKFEYSPLGKFFNKESDERDKKEGLLKRLKIIQGKNEEQLKAIKDHGENQLDAIKNNNLLKAKKKDDKTKDIVYLEERVDKLDSRYPKSFDSNSIFFVGKDWKL